MFRFEVVEYISSIEIPYILGRREYMEIQY